MCTPIAVRLVADLTVLVPPCNKDRSRLLERIGQVLVAVAVLCVGLIAFPPIAEAQSVTSSLITGSTPYAVAVNPVTNKVYVANENSGTVTVIDGATNTTTAVAVEGTPHALAVNPVTNKVYVVNTGSGTVTVIDEDTNTTTTV